MTTSGNKLESETGNLFVLTGILFNLFILTAFGAMFWFVYALFAHISQVELYLRGFTAI